MFFVISLICFQELMGFLVRYEVAPQMVTERNLQVFIVQVDCFVPACCDLALPRWWDDNYDPEEEPYRQLTNPTDPKALAAFHLFAFLNHI